MKRKQTQSKLEQIKTSFTINLKSSTVQFQFLGNHVEGLILFQRLGQWFSFQSPVTSPVTLLLFTKLCNINDFWLLKYYHLFIITVFQHIFPLICAQQCNYAYCPLTFLSQHSVLLSFSFYRNKWTFHFLQLCPPWNSNKIESPSITFCTILRITSDALQIILISYIMAPIPCLIESYRFSFFVAWTHAYPSSLLNFRCSAIRHNTLEKDHFSSMITSKLLRICSYQDLLASIDSSLDLLACTLQKCFYSLHKK